MVGISLEPALREESAGGTASNFLLVVVVVAEGKYGILTSLADSGFLFCFLLGRWCGSLRRECFLVVVQGMSTRDIDTGELVDTASKGYVVQQVEVSRTGSRQRKWT